MQTRTFRFGIQGIALLASLSILACDGCKDEPAACDRPAIQTDNLGGGTAPLSLPSTTQFYDATVTFTEKVSGVNTTNVTIVDVNNPTATIATIGQPSSADNVTWAFRIDGLVSGGTYRVSFGSGIETDCGGKFSTSDPTRATRNLIVESCLTPAVSLDATSLTLFNDSTFTTTTAVWNITAPASANATDGLIEANPTDFGMTGCPGPAKLWVLPVRFDFDNTGCPWTPSTSTSGSVRDGVVIHLVKAVGSKDSSASLDTIDQIVPSGDDIVVGTRYAVMNSGFGTLDRDATINFNLPVTFKSLDEDSGGNCIDSPVWFVSLETILPSDNYYWMFAAQGFQVTPGTTNITGFQALSRHGTSDGHFVTSTTFTITQGGATDTWLLAKAYDAAAGTAPAYRVTCLPFRSTVLEYGRTLSTNPANATWDTDVNFGNSMFGHNDAAIQPITSTLLTYLQGGGQLEGLYDHMLYHASTLSITDELAVYPGDSTAGTRGILPAWFNVFGHFYSGTMQLASGPAVKKVYNNSPHGTSQVDADARIGQYIGRYQLQSGSTYYVRCSPMMGTLSKFGDYNGDPAAAGLAAYATPPTTGDLTATPMKYIIELAGTNTEPTITGGETADITADSHLCNNGKIIDAAGDCTSGADIGLTTNVLTTPTDSLIGEFNSLADIHWIKMTVP